MAVVSRGDEDLGGKSYEGIHLRKSSANQLSFSQGAPTTLFSSPSLLRSLQRDTVRVVLSSSAHLGRRVAPGLRGTVGTPATGHSRFGGQRVLSSPPQDARLHVDAVRAAGKST